MGLILPAHLRQGTSAAVDDVRERRRLNQRSAGNDGADCFLRERCASVQIQCLLTREKIQLDYVFEGE
jgi:hypothetical protein